MAGSQAEHIMTLPARHCKKTSENRSGAAAAIAAQPVWANGSSQRDLGQALLGSRPRYSTEPSRRTAHGSSGTLRGPRAGFASSSPGKNAIVAFFPTRQVRSKLFTARKITTYVAILGSHRAIHAVQGILPRTARGSILNGRYRQRPEDLTSRTNRIAFVHGVFRFAAVGVEQIWKNCEIGVRPAARAGIDPGALNWRRSCPLFTDASQSNAAARLLLHQAFSIPANIH